ncbi:META domain-containing protein [Neisseria sp. Ec49-e6-T10]|uniref:META domain-containing protein n=1 Tax=Neisseria sp. Ec49-e6-T10 TaxID=3140744 RepID=UPI003EB953B8
MKKTVSLCALAALLITTGCTSMPQNHSNSVTTTDLQHRNFALLQFNGQTLPTDNKYKNPNLEFAEGMHISGAVCNRFNGQAQLNNNVLSAPNLAATRMMCEPTLNQIESALFKTLSDGATISFDGKTLTLKNSQNTFVYTIADYVR